MSWWVNINRIVTKEYAEKENSKRNIEDDEVTELIKKLSEVDPYDYYIRSDLDRERLVEIVDNAELLLDTKIKEGDSIFDYSADISLSYNCKYIIEALGVTIEEFQKLKGQELYSFIDIALSILYKELELDTEDLEQNEIQPYEEYLRRLNSNETFNHKEKIVYREEVSESVEALHKIYDYLYDVSDKKLEDLVVDLS